MKITHITAENFLGIRRADVALDRPITLFGGGNYAGKSSLQEAVRMALTGETVRVELKKEYAALVNDGEKNGFAEVCIGEETASIVLPSGKASRSNGFTPPAALPYVLDAQRFSSMDDKARRAFLFGLMGIKITPETVSQRLLAAGHDKARVDRVAPTLRAGFDAACTEAKSKATEAKGAWRALTGETYGSVKAASWAAPAVSTDPAALTAAQQQLADADKQIAEANQALGALQADMRTHTAREARIEALRAPAERVARVETKLAADEKDLAGWEAKVQEAEAKAAGAAPTQPLTCPHCRGLVELAGGELKAHTVPDGVRDEEAAAALPELVRSRELLRSAVANDKRDLQAARDAAVELKTLTEGEQPAAPKQSDIDAATQGLATLRQKRANAAAEVAKLEALVQAGKEAASKTATAAGHHADVVAWDALAADLAPDGIPGQMLAEALDPINTRLQQSSLDAEWLRIGISADMSITCLTPGGSAREYRLLSESERWRADAMVAEAISFQSGLKLLVLDRFDVLDAQGRGDLLLWLDVLAQNGELDTALLFGTLKALPSDLPATVAAEWINNGHVGQLKEAA
ncbi:AAA family ATPase [Variovorax paradoxus]|uniref:AAA family ATPase n=1 Tax=Variovorax paradoxus TaxID=34073 RepID=UPI0019325202|nr:AAA family ATPase [Variovorax paradoxus]